MKDYEVGSKQVIDAGDGMEVRGTIVPKKCLTCAKQSVLKADDFPSSVPHHCMNGCITVEFMDLEKGDRVFIRSNDDTPLIIGEIIDFEQFGRKAPSSQDAPVVKSEADEEIYTCMGICMAYSDRLLEILNALTPKKQWNYLANNYNRR